MRQKNKTTTLYIVFILFLLSGQTLFAQKLYQIVSVDIREQRLEDALATISKKANFYFSYSSNYIPNDSVVSVSAKNNTVKEVLDLLLNEKYEYKEAHNYIILRPAPFRMKLIPEEVTDKDNWFTVAGYVVDERTGAKVMQASVYEKRLLSSTLTDRQGYFKLKLSKKENEIALTVSKELYRDITLVILPSTNVVPGGHNGYNPEDDSEKLERTAFGRLFISSRQRIQSLNLSGFFTNSPFQASLTPGLGSHGIFNSQVINKFSLNLLGGYTSGVKGLEIAGGFNINKGSVSYVQAAGIFNFVGGSVKGLQLAGVTNTIFNNVDGAEFAGAYNHVLGDFSGIQAAGGANINKKNVKYIQLAGAFNHVGGSVKGVQIAGAFNFVKDSVSGVEIAGFGNEVRRSFTGMQLAGAYNRAGKELNGVQISGALNITEQKLKGMQLSGAGNISNAETHGVQISGLFNYARKLKGFQLGIVNISDSSSGVSIGLLNIIKGGYHKISISTNEIMDTNISFKSGNAKLYTIYCAGMNIFDKKNAFAFGFGLGHDFILSKKALVSTEAITSTISVGNWEDLNTLNRAKATFSYELLKGISVFAGPAFNIYLSNNIEKADDYKYIEPSEKFIFDYSKTVKGWIGFEAGLTFF